MAELESLVDDVLDKLPEASRPCSPSGVFRPEEKVAMLDRVFAGTGCRRCCLNFLRCSPSTAGWIACGRFAGRAEAVRRS